jgi:hypothetical protein|tara:strand:- start:155 stop:448 length:294 start_codon:yes stop_codon:yes gene_type:complete
MFEQQEMDFFSAKKNLNKQATKILHDIASAYTQGILDDPNKAQAYCNMLACICEGKVEGLLDEDTMEVKWSLTTKYQEYINELRAAIVSDNVVKGPW